MVKTFAFGDLATDEASLLNALKIIRRSIDKRTLTSKRIKGLFRADLPVVIGELERQGFDIPEPEDLDLFFPSE